MTTSPYTLPSNTPRAKRKGEEGRAALEREVMAGNRLRLLRWVEFTQAICVPNIERALGANGAAK